MGIVFDVQKFCVHDGPGIRTSVFLKGCMMRCIWCHNPESFSAKKELSYKAQSCVNCKACEKVCPNGVHTFTLTDDKHSVDFNKCTTCGKCVDNCPVESLTMFGKEMSAREVIDEVVKDRNYYKTSGGGVTFTGGEPTMQFDFLMELLTLSKEENIHICLETNGVIPNDHLLKILPYIDLFLLDYKATGDELHKKLTGVPQTLIHNTIKTLREYDKPINLRCPVIQGTNDTQEHFETIKQLQLENKNIIKAEIMAYHSYGKHKWDLIGKDYELEQLESASPEQKSKWESAISIS